MVLDIVLEPFDRMVQSSNHHCSVENSIQHKACGGPVSFPRFRPNGLAHEGVCWRIKTILEPSATA